MKRQRKLSLLDPNILVGMRNAPKVALRSGGQENQSRKRKQPNCDDDTVAKKIMVTSSQFEETGCCSSASSQKSQKRASFVMNEFLLSPEYFEDILASEIHLSSRIKLSKSFCNNPMFAVTPFHREVTVDWLIDLQGCLKIGNDALHHAVTLMDIVLDTQKISEDEIQALAAAAMWLAHKFLYGVIKANLILKFCKSISREQLLLNERRILKATDMNLMFPNAMTILHSQLYCVFGEEIPLVEYHMSNFLLEIMLLVVDFARDSICKRAKVAMETALQLLQSRPDNDLQYIKGATSGLIIHKRLISTLRQVWNKPSFKENSSLFRKYSSSNKQCVSLHPGLDPDFLEC